MPRVIQDVGRALDCFVLPFFLLTICLLPLGPGLRVWPVWFVRLEQYMLLMHREVDDRASTAIKDVRSIAFLGMVCGWYANPAVQHEATDHQPMQLCKLFESHFCIPFTKAMLRDLIQFKVFGDGAVF